MDSNDGNEGDADMETMFKKEVQQLTNIDDSLLKISCELDEICLEIDNEFFETYEISSKRKLHLWNESCLGSEVQHSTGSNWKWCTRQNNGSDIDDFDCGTKSEVNETHLVYRNALTRNMAPGDIIIGSQPYKTLSLPFGCAWPLNVFVSTSHDTEFQVQDTIVVESDVSGVGSYKAKMYLYENVNFHNVLETSPVLDMDDTVYVGVKLLDADKGVNIIIERAWATPVASPYVSAIQVPIVDHRCPSLEANEELNVQLYVNGQDSLSTFSTSVFKIGKFEASYLHAEVRVCFEDKQTCPIKDLQCPPRPIPYAEQKRFTRAVDKDNVVSIGPIYIEKKKKYGYLDDMEDDDYDFVDHHNLIKSTTLNKTDMLIAALLALVLLLSITVITLYIRWRKAQRKRSGVIRKGSLNEVVTVTR